MATVISCIPALDPKYQNDSPDYSSLLEFIRLENRYEPLYAFNEYEETFDAECHEASLGYLRDNPALIRQIKSDLDSTKLTWEMVKSRKRIVFVPENRHDFAELYLSYCRDIVDFIIAETNLDNPYIQIRHPVQSFPDFPEIDNRVTVFLVHNLAKQYSSTYSFIGESEKNAVNLSLSGTVYTGEIGSYASVMKVLENGQLVFFHNHYTIWQNSAKSPVNTLILPLEETLHIALRPYTESAIEDQWMNSALKTISEARRIVAHWIAVEEAIAGGLAHHYFPLVADRYVIKIEPSEIDRALHLRAKKEKYTYLKSGIQIIQNLGPDSTLDMYRRSPQKFRDLLISAEKV